MHPWLIRHILFPLHERCVGRHTVSHVRELNQSQWLSPNDIKKLQNEKLRALISHACTHTPFYRNRINDAGVDLESDNLLTQLHKLPLLDKSQIRQHKNDMVWHAAPGGLQEYNTGGSGGEPLIFWIDRRRQAYDQAARIRAHNWFGVRFGEPETYLWGSPIEWQRSDTIKRVRDRLFNQRLLNAFDMTSQSMNVYLDEINRVDPISLYGYPSSLALLAEHGRSQRRTLKLKRLRAVFVTGEVCYDHHRQVIEDFFNAPAIDNYGSRDGGFIAHQCPKLGMHITAENIIVEIVRDGLVVPEGESGEIIITHLDAYAMPMIRYRSGDIGRLRHGRCECGRGLPMLDVVEGRSTDLLRLPDGTVKHALAVIYPLRSTLGVEQFQVRQHADHSVTIDVVCDNKIARVTRESVASSVKPIFGEQVGITVNLVDRIATSPSGKHHYVVSHVGSTERRDSVDGH